MILEISRDMIREIIGVYKDNQTLCHQRVAHQKLNTDIKRRIGKLTSSDANLSDQKIVDIIEHESGIIISRC
jgi:DNA-directed RNA polymerase specialized sigma54-like protein